MKRMRNNLDEGVGLQKEQQMEICKMRMRYRNLKGKPQLTKCIFMFILRTLEHFIHIQK